MLVSSNFTTQWKHPRVCSGVHFGAQVSSHCPKTCSPIKRWFIIVCEIDAGRHRRLSDIFLFIKVVYVIHLHDTTSQDIYYIWQPAKWTSLPRPYVKQGRFCKFMRSSPQTSVTVWNGSSPGSIYCDFTVREFLASYLPWWVWTADDWQVKRNQLP